MIDIRGGQAQWSVRFSELLDPTLHRYLKDLAEYSAHTFLSGFDHPLYNQGFVRGRKYERSDVFRLLCWPENPVAQNVGGYMKSPDGANCPVFVTYDKDEGVSATTQYEDRFLDSNRMQWYTKSRRTLDSPDVVYFRDVTLEQRIPLFVKKSDDEGKAFYYLGDVRPEADSFAQEKMPDGRGDTVSVVRMVFELDEPVSESLYNYLVD